MPFIEVTFDTFHDASGWLKASVSANAFAMSVTLDVFHDPTGWLNAFAL